MDQNYFKEIIGKKITAVEKIEQGVSNLYTFTLDDNERMYFSHNDSEGAVWGEKVALWHCESCGKDFNDWKYSNTGKCDLCGSNNISIVEEKK